MSAPARPRSTDLVASILRSRVLPYLLVAVAGLLSIAVHHWVYPHLSWNRDELTYLWHVDVLRSGRLAAPDGGFPDLFRPFLTATGDGTIFSQYPIGWPAPILLGSMVGAPWLTLWGATAIVVLGTRALALELGESKVVAGLAGVVMLGSPIVALHSGIFLNYLFTLGLGLYFVVAVLSGVRLMSPARLAIAGALLGWIFLTRPYDAVIWAAIVAVQVAVVDLRGGDRAHLVSRLRLAGWGVVAMAPFVVAQLWINHRLTGSITEFAMTAKDPLDTFGFGERRIMPLFPPVDYTLGLAVSSLARNLYWMPFFMAGAHVAAVVAAFAVWTQRRREQTWFLVGLGAVFALAYLVFWGNHISSMIARLNGPIYLIPAYAPLSIIVARQLVDWWRRRPRSTVVLAVGLVVISLLVTGNRLLLNRDLSMVQEPWFDSESELSGPHLVVVSTAEYLHYLNPAGRNSPGLDDEILYVTDVSAELIDLMASQPHRIAVQQVSSLSEADLIPSETPRAPTITFVPLVVESGESVEVRAQVVATGQPAIVVRVTAGDAVVERVISDAEAGEVVDLSWTLVASGGDSAQSDLGDGVIVVDESLASIEIELSDGATPDQAASALSSFRHRWWARSRLGRVEILAPGRSFVMADEATVDEPNWLEVDEIAELTVEVEATSR